VDIGFVIRQGLVYFKDRIADYSALGSGYRFENILEFTITFLENQPFSAGAPNLALPDILQRKVRSLINVPGEDEKCFQRAVHLHQALRPPFPSYTSQGIQKMLNRKSYQDQILEWNNQHDKVNWKGIKFPFQISQVKKFERQNPYIGLCIIGFDEDRELKQEPEIRIHTSIDDTIDDVIGSADEEEEREPTEHMRQNELRQEVRSKCFILHACKEERPIQIDLLMYITPITNHLLYIKSLTSLLFRTQNTSMKACRFSPPV